MMEEPGQGAEMSFWDHLDELRGTLGRSLAVLAVFTCVGLAFKTILFERIILAPTSGDFCVYKALGWKFSMELINVDISAQFFAHLKASLAAGIILAFPYLVWEIWKFIAPALYEGEKKAVSSAFGLSTVLFYLGVVVGYFFVLPVCLNFFMNYTVSDQVTNNVTLSSYMSMFTSMVLLIGIVFEFPTVIAALARLGVVDRDDLKKFRKYAFLVILAVAALVTPSDPFSMLVLSAPLYLLYEFSILLCGRK